MSKTSSFRIVLVAMVSGLLQACASSVETSVTAFHQLSPSPSPNTVIAVLPWRQESSDSLEFKAYATRIEARLRERGYAIAEPGRQATHAMFVNYGIDDGRTVASTYSIPRYGVTGYGSARTTGTVSTYGNTSYVNTTTTQTPTYGVTGYQTGVSTQRIFTRFVSVDLVELATPPESPRKVFEGRLRSEGSCGNFVSIMPFLIDAIFTDFPGPSGRAVKRNMKWSGVC